MRFAVFSDLHLEQRPNWSMPLSLPPFDIAVVAGDIDGSCSRAVETLAAMPALDGRPVVFVAGNHEHYRHVFQDNVADGLAAARGTDVRLLAPGATVIDGVRFLGATLWTDYRLDGDAGHAMALANRYMSDHALIEYRAEDGIVELFSPLDARAEHQTDLAFLAHALARPHSGPTVVVTHHLPSRRSVSRRSASDPLNPAFASDLDHFIQCYQPNLWTHAHSHSSCDYRHSNTQVLANLKRYRPGRGAVVAENTAFDLNLIVEIGGAMRGDGVEL